MNKYMPEGYDHCDVHDIIFNHVKPNARLIITLPPRHGKTSIANAIINQHENEHFDADMLYISRSFEAAVGNTFLSNSIKKIGWGTSLHGGYSLIVCDDLINDAADARSDEMNEKRLEYIKEVLLRLDINGSLIFIGSRWAENDYLKQVETLDDFVRLDFSAIDKSGKALFSWHSSEEKLLRVKESVSAEQWKYLYQQGCVCQY